MNDMFLSVLAALDIVNDKLDVLLAQTRYYYYDSGSTRYRVDTSNNDLQVWESGDDSVGLYTGWVKVFE